MNDFPEVLKAYWGKAHAKEGGPGHHLFVYHCLDVAAVAARWWEIDPALRSVFIRTAGNQPPEFVRAWVLFFVALHDLGKLDFRFQLKARPVAELLNPRLKNPKIVAEQGFFDHGPAGFNWFKREKAGYGIMADEEMKPWMEAVAGHHGRPDSGFKSPKTDPSVLVNDASARRCWLSLLEELFLKPVGLSLADTPPPMPDLLAGFCCVCDWVGSNDEVFKYVPTPDLSPLEYFTSRTNDADFAPKALAESGMTARPAAEGGMALVFADLKPRGVQTVIDDLPVGPGLFLIEAPTGQGKTEAATALASRLIAEGFASSVVFALPTQATANAMLARLAHTEDSKNPENPLPAQRMFPGTKPSFVLAHGKARFSHQFRYLKRAATGPTAQGQEEAAAQCAKWLAQSRKRVFLGQFGVCTVDQVLLSALPVKHHFVRSFGLGRSVLVVDEVHAYDEYMNTILDRVIERQKRAGGSVILLSATLPERRRAEIFKKWGVAELEPADDTAYPLVTASVEGRVVTRKPETEEVLKPVNFEVRRVEGMTLDPETIQRISAKVREGALVAVMCNLVADAQAFAEILKAVPEFEDRVDLFHARYRFKDRDEIEKRVLKTYGKQAERGAEKGRVIVATQVIEQSLDLDFDWLITQICPIELLIQRVGRLWRHERPVRFGVSAAECLVLSPAGDDFGLHAVVYDTPKWLWRTRDFIEREPKAEFPSVNRKWLREAYSDEQWTHEPPELEAAHEKYEIDQLTKRAKARSLLSAERDGVTAFADTEGNAGLMTRDGQMSLKVLPVLAGATRRTLEGEAFPTNDFELDELIDRNTVAVPYSWIKFLPKPEEDIYFLEIQPRTDGSWASADGRFAYDNVFGLRMEALVS